MDILFVNITFYSDDIFKNVIDNSYKYSDDKIIFYGDTICQLIKKIIIVRLHYLGLLSILIIIQIK